MKTIDQIKQIAESLKPHGMRVGFHSEADFFKDVDGARPWDVLADNTPADVVLQLDTGNVQTARPEGVDVVQVFKRNPGRIKTMHVKPFSKVKPDAFIGEDELPWADIIKESQAQIDTRHYESAPKCAARALRPTTGPTEICVDT